MSTIIASRCTSRLFCLYPQPSSSSILCSALRRAKATPSKQTSKSLSSAFRTYSSKSQPTRSRKSTKPLQPPPLPRTTPRSASVSTPSSTPGYTTTQDLLTHTLSNKPSPTLLYIAPSSNTFAITCLGVGASALSYGLYNFYDAYLVPHPGLWWLVPYMMAGVSVFMIGTGVWIGLGARRLVGTLSAVPTRLGHISHGKGVSGDSGLMVRLESKPILPFLSIRTIDAPLSDVHLGTRVAPVAAGLTTFNSSLRARGQQPLPARKRQAELRELQENEEKTLWHVLTGPFRTFLSAGMSGIGRVVARDGFVSLYVQGTMWRLDVKEGWVLDDGTTIDRLLKLR